LLQVQIPNVDPFFNSFVIAFRALDGNIKHKAPSSKIFFSPLRPQHLMMPHPQQQQQQQQQFLNE
jgi:hypothetical protein